VLTVSFPVAQLKQFLDSMRTRYSRLTDPKKKKSGQASVDLTDRDKWVLERFGFLKNHIVRVSSRSTTKVSSINTLHSYPLTELNEIKTRTTFSSA